MLDIEKRTSDRAIDRNSTKIKKIKKYSTITIGQATLAKTQFESTFIWSLSDTGKIRKKRENNPIYYY